MSLVERLGYKTLDDFYSDYDNNMIAEWMAYDMTQNTEWAEKARVALSLEQQKENDGEKEAELIRNMFKVITHANG